MYWSQGLKKKKFLLHTSNTNWNIHMVVPISIDCNLVMGARVWEYGQWWAFSTWARRGRNREKCSWIGFSPRSSIHTSQDGHTQRERERVRERNVVHWVSPRSSIHTSLGEVKNVHLGLVVYMHGKIDICVKVFKFVDL